MILQSRSI